MDTADAPPQQGTHLAAIDDLRRALGDGGDDDIEFHLARQRFEAYRGLEPESVYPSWPPREDSANSLLDEPLPQLTAAELSGASVRERIHARGAVQVPGLLDQDQVAAFIAGIDRAIAVRSENEHRTEKSRSPWFRGLRLPPAEAATLGRPWVARAGGMLACDSPRLLEMLFSTYEQIGLREVITDYLGERPVLSANKCTMRKVPTTASTDWHQDGAFLGTGIRALNVWIALTDCGVDAPGLDLVPRRFEEVQETGTGGAIFDWAVGPDVVERLAVDAPVVRPRFAAGDALLFDDLFLHRTAIEATMTRSRYAIESWFFAPTGYPDGQVPLVW